MSTGVNKISMVEKQFAVIKKIKVKRRLFFLSLVPTSLLMRLVLFKLMDDYTSHSLNNPARWYKQMSTIVKKISMTERKILVIEKI